MDAIRVNTNSASVLNFVPDYFITGGDGGGGGGPAHHRRTISIESFVTGRERSGNVSNFPPEFSSFLEYREYKGCFPLHEDFQW